VFQEKESFEAEEEKRTAPKLSMQKIVQLVGYSLRNGKTYTPQN
jgi:hypothetical protein